MEAIRIERRDSSTARVPNVEPGEAIVFTRYGEERTVALNPADFRRLLAFDEALEALAPDDQPQLTELERKALALEDEPGTPLEDPDAIREFLGR